jgi:hypothetical protein
MNKIAPSVYESLTIRQRVIASIEAEARGDGDERQRLISSCPKLIYHQTDARFSEMMEKLMGLAMAVEADLRECVLKFLVIGKLMPETSGRFLQDFANIREAWKVTVRTMGIDEKSMALAGPPSSLVFEMVEALLPEPNTNRSEMLSAEMLTCLE